MKKIHWVFLLSLSLILGGCGCFEPKENPEEIKTEDSLAEVDRNESLDDADRMLREADSLEQVRQDSIDKAQEKVKK